MPRSPQRRHGLVIDLDKSWPLSNTPLALDPPALTLSPASSSDSVELLYPSTPTTEPGASVLLPGFHFSTMDENVDPAAFHRIAAQLLSGELSKRDSAVAGASIDHRQTRQLHCDLGKDPSGRYCCSCGKSYAQSVKLRGHIATCAGTSQYPCTTCDKVFETREQLDRHVTSRHNSNLEVCPECGEKFPASQLPKHLASGLGGCDGMIQKTMGPAPEIDRAYRYSARTSASQHFWIYDGDLSWQQRKKSVQDSRPGNDNDEVVEQTIGVVKRLLRRPASQQDTDLCDLCGETFSREGETLAQHIGEHSLDFAEKRHRCDDCIIYFANEKDLDRHLQSANLNHHCGFTFRHNTGTCSGHHPPTYYKSSLKNDHDLMQRHLWNWELSQLRTHRVTIARLLAERLTLPKQKHMSVQDCRQTYASLLPHISLASRDSLRSHSAWNQELRKLEIAQLDAHITRIMSETFPEENVEILKRIEEANEVLEIRPDSMVISKDPIRGSKRLSKTKSVANVTRKKTTAVDAVKLGHKRTYSGPISFLKNRLSLQSSRPQSLPVPAPIV